MPDDVYRQRPAALDGGFRTVEIDGQTWYVLADALVAAGMEGADRNPMFVARIPDEHRQQLKLDGRWTWLVTEFGADFAAGQGWREHGVPGADFERAATRAYAKQADERRGPGRRPSEDALFRRIADEYRQKIRSGELRHGDTLPNSTELAAAWSVNPTTVLKAMKVLREEGLISTAIGRYAQPRVLKVATNGAH